MLQEQLKVFTLHKDYSNYSLEAPVSIPWIMDQLFEPAAKSENKLLDAQKKMKECGLLVLDSRYYLYCIQLC